MKIKILSIILFICLVLLSGCENSEPVQVTATTLPVYQFTATLCEGTGIQVSQLITQSVSCLHDYSLNVAQVRTLEAAEVVIISGAGLEDFMSDALRGAKNVVDSSEGVTLLESCGHHHEEDHGHRHEQDSHIWLSPANAVAMAQNIAQGLIQVYPEQKPIIQNNLMKLQQQLQELEQYGNQQLSGLACRDLITFHDGFGYLAQAFDLHILEAIEEESGCEASAQELKEMIGIVTEHDLPAVFTERNGSVSAAQIIAAETGAGVYSLDMAMSEGDYFDAMYHNIDTIREAMK